jgi:hypothetical protein
MTNIFSSTARPPPTGTLAEVRHYWRETWPNAMDARLQPRRATAEEVFPHLALNRAPSSAPVKRTSTVAVGPARVAHSPAARAGARTSAPQAPQTAVAVGPAGSLHGQRGSFIDPAQQARGCVSPLGNRIW